MRGTPLSIPQILAWADAYRQRHGRFPDAHSGPVQGTNEVWHNLNACLRRGGRGLPGRSSLARLLAEHRGHRNKKALPPYNLPQILKWADAWHRRHGAYPRRTSGPIPDAPGETWARVSDALVRGLRGLPGGSSLAQFLAEHRGVPNDKALPRLTQQRILEWVDAWRRRTGQWPKDRSGPVPQEPGTTWAAVDLALRNGRRGLPGGSSLARLLQRHRGVRNEKGQPRLTEAAVWAWMVSHRCRTGHWPTPRSGRIIGTPHETWKVVNGALQRGRRGLPGGSSLRKVLERRLGSLG